MLVNNFERLLPKVDWPESPRIYGSDAYHRCGCPAENCSIARAHTDIDNQVPHASDHALAQERFEEIVRWRVQGTDDYELDKGSWV